MIVVVKQKSVVFWCKDFIFIFLVKVYWWQYIIFQDHVLYKKFDFFKAISNYSCHVNIVYCKCEYW